MQAGFSFFWSLVVPAAITAGSVVLTWLLYRHFAGKMPKQAGQDLNRKASRKPRTAVPPRV
jgi:hypothetical protein